MSDDKSNAGAQDRIRATSPTVSIIRVGTAGWDYPDWQGTVFPKPKPKGFDPLAYLAKYFDTIEINSTFYRPASAKVATSWLKRVEENPNFRFTAKLWRHFTHERGTAWTKADVAEARAGLDVLLKGGRLGAVLLQFPWSFRKDEANQEWLADLCHAFRHLPLVLEVRHSSWTEPATVDWLLERRVGLVNIDQPLFHNSVKPAGVVTAPIGYVRLHGRNYKEWFRKTAGRDERYDYLYTSEELRPWVKRIATIAAQTEETYAITNNHRHGQAPANAAMINGLLTEDPQVVPPPLLSTYAKVLAPYVASPRPATPHFMT